MRSKETWDENTGTEIVKTSAKAIAVCVGLVVIGVTLGAAEGAFGTG